MRNAGTKRRLAALACAVMVLVGCENKISKANFDKIQKGMTLAQVETILGGSGEEDSSPQGMTINEAGVAGSSRESKERIYVWKSDSGQITVVTVDGKVVEARQTGL
jgi:hypothetical protein